MKADQAKTLADRALTELATALEQGRSDALTAYLGALSRFHDYSFGNVMLIASQKPDATRVSGFRTWKKLGRWVKKGEKGIAIIAPVIGKKRDADEDRTICGFRAVYVFDISQTDGEPLPEPNMVQGDPGTHADRLKALVGSRGIALEYSDELGSSLGRSKGGTIQLADGLDAATEFSVLVHELAHEMLHHDDTKRSKKVRETEAEAVAFVVCRSTGLQTGTAASDYIQLYQGSKETLAESLDRIQRTSADILSGLEPAAYC